MSVGRIRETEVDSVIFRTRNSREEVQSLKGQGIREVARNQRENCEDRATWQEIGCVPALVTPQKRCQGNKYPNLTCQSSPLASPASSQRAGTMWMLPIQDSYQEQGA